MARARFATLFFLLAVALAATGCSSAGSSEKGDCGFAFVFQTPIAPSVYQQQVDAGIKEASKRLKVKINSVESTDVAAIETNLRAFAQERCYKVVATSGPLGGDGLKRVAAQFPKQNFAIFDAAVKAPNVASFEFANEQGTYVVGVLAALLTKSKTVAATFGLDLPVLKRYRYGFEQGVKSVDPKTKVLVQFAGSFSDPAKSLTAALTARAQGADLVFPQTGADYTVVRQACSKDYRIVGAFEPDAVKAKSDCVLSLFSSNISGGVTRLFEGVTNGTIKQGEIKQFTLSDGAFTMAPITPSQQPYDERIPRDIVVRVKAVYDDIAAGKITVANPLQQ